MVGNNLKSARNKLGLSQNDLAKSLGVHVVQYGNYERGINKPSCDILEKLASIHNININYLLRIALSSIEYSTESSILESARAFSSDTPNVSLSSLTKSNINLDSMGPTSQTDTVMHK